MDANLVERIDRPSTEDSEPKIFTVEQAEELLQKASKYGLLPYISLGLFAGLRSAELMRLDGKAVKFEDRSIIVGQEVAKKRVPASGGHVRCPVCLVESIEAASWADR